MMNPLRVPQVSRRSPAERSAPPGRKRISLPWTGIVLMCIVAVMSLIPGRARHWMRLSGLVHSLAHGVAFGVIALGMLGRSSSRRASALSLIAAVAGGMLIEFFQHCLYRNAYEWADVLDDSVGVAAGALMRASLHSPVIAGRRLQHAPGNRERRTG